MNKSDIFSAVCSFGTFAYGVYLVLISGGEFTVTGLIKAGAAIVFGFIFSIVYSLPILKTGYSKVKEYIASKKKIVVVETKVETKEPEVEGKVEIIEQEQEEEIIPVAKEDKVTDCLDVLLEAFSSNPTAVEHLKALYTIQLDEKIKKLTGDKVDEKPAV